MDRLETAYTQSGYTDIKKFTFQYGQIRNEGQPLGQMGGHGNLHSSMDRLETWLMTKQYKIIYNLHSSMDRLETFLLLSKCDLGNLYLHSSMDRLETKNKRFYKKI